MAMEEQTTGVRILTIHKSKGLEFEAVIAPFLNWETTGINDFLISPDEKSGPLKVYSASSQLMETSLEEEYLELKERAFIEAINLLYVVMTRPIQHFIGLFPGSKKR